MNIPKSEVKDDLSFASNLRAERGRTRIALVSLSEKLGLAPAVVTALERGLVYPSPELLDDIAKALETEPSVLMPNHGLEAVAA